MLKSSKRLSRASFEKVFTGGKIVRTKNFNFRILKDPTLQGLFAVSVSKKDFKTAVSRNKNKRRVYSIIREINKENRECSVMSKNNTTQSISAIVFVKKTAELEKYSLLKTEIADILK